MEPIMRVVQTAQGSKEFWKELDPHELRDYYSFRMNTVKGIYSVAYKNPDGQIVVVVQSELSRVHKLAVTVDGKGINTEVPPHSITTFIVETDKDFIKKNLWFLN